MTGVPGAAIARATRTIERKPHDAGQGLSAPCRAPLRDGFIPTTAL